MKNFSKALVALASVPTSILISVLALGGSAHALSFTNNTSTAIADNTAADLTFNVSGEAAITSAVTILVNITNATPNQLDIFLTSPSGRILELSTNNGTSGSYNLTFSDLGATNITAAGSVASGTFRPEGSLTASGLPVSRTGTITTLAGFNGANPNGNWTLRIGDDTTGSATQFNSATLNITSVTAVPFEFSPVSGALLIGGAAALHMTKKKRQQIAK